MQPLNSLNWLQHLNYLVPLLIAESNKILNMCSFLYLCESYDFVFKQYLLTIEKSNSYLSLFNLMKKIISNIDIKREVTKSFN